MEPYNRRLSYCSLQSIIPLLPYGKRMCLSKSSKTIRGILSRSSNKTPKSLEHVKFSQEYRKLGPYSFATEHSGVLKVEDIEYVFNYDKKAERVSIECSLRPGRRMISTEKDIARQYFQYFLQFPIGHLELKGCCKPFKRDQQLKTQFLTWDSGPHFFDCWLEEPFGVPRSQMWQNNIPVPREQWIPKHHFKRFELRTTDACLLLVMTTCMEFIDHLVVHLDSQRKSGDRVMLNFQNFENKILQVTQRMKTIHGFMDACHVVVNNNLKPGSFIKGIFEYSPDRKESVFKKLTKSFEVPVERVERERVVLKTEGSVVYEVLYEHDPIGNKETFEVRKIERTEQ